MRGSLAITNGEITSPLRSEAEACADMEAIYRARRIADVENAFSGTPPSDRERWFEARDRARLVARQPSQHDEHIEAYRDHLHGLWRKRLEAENEKRERYR